MSEEIEEKAEEQSEEKDYESLARQDGWVPQEEWKGDPEQWRDAKTFYERGQEFQPFLRAKLRRYEEKINQFESVIGKHEQFYSQAIERTKKERDAALNELKRLKAQAISEGDGEKVLAIESDMQALEREPEQQQIDPAVEKWVRESDWYNKDVAMTAYADAIGPNIRARMPHLTPAQFLDELNAAVEAEFEHKVRNKGPQTVETSTPAKRQSKKERGYDALPPEAKAACDEFIKTVPGFTKEKYLENYDWSE